MSRPRFLRGMRVPPMMPERGTGVSPVFRRPAAPSPSHP